MKTNRADLRSFLAEADAAGLTLQIDKPVDVATEIGALCSETVRPTVFSNLRGFDGFQLTDCLIRFRETQALALGLDRSDPAAVLTGYLGILARGPGELCTVDEAPIKDVIWRDRDADLRKLPIPVPSEGLDIPHLGLSEADFHVPTISGGMAITSHPDGGQNTFYSMAKVIDATRIHFFMLPGHTSRNIAAWSAKGERCPMAFVIGCHPAYEIGASYTGPHEGFSELHLISTILGEPVPVIQAETVDLQVPAMAEIVIEGTIDPDKARYLHMSSHTDTFSPIFSKEPFFDVTAITMRAAPIYRHIQPNRFTDHHSLSEFIVAMPLLKALRDKGLPVRDVHIPLRSCVNCAIIQMSASNPAEVREAMLTGLSNPICPRLTIVVDEDIDIYNVEDVLYAVSIRTDPGQDLATFNGVRGYPEPLVTRINSPDDISVTANNRWAIDATKPSLSEPHRRLEMHRLRARGEHAVKLADFM